MPKTSSLAAGTVPLVGCNNDTLPAKVGSGAGQANDTGAPSRRVTTQGDARTNGGSQ